MASLPEYALMLGIGLLVIGGVIVGVQEFRDTQSSSDASYEVLNDTLNMFGNFGDQLSTVGTMLGVGIIIAIIGVAFLGVGYGRRKGYF